MLEDKIIVGALEICDLPKLEISRLHIRVDTGAKTSSLHVDNIEEFTKNGEAWVKFDIHPNIYEVEKIVRRSAKVIATRVIKSSSGERQLRYLIKTQIVLNKKAWNINLTLSDRSSMTYLMLLGRQAMGNHLLVDPSAQYLLGC